jgi:hypothetical protein
MEGIHGRTSGCKWNLLKVTKESMVGPGGIWRPRDCVSFPGAFETYTNQWEGKNLVIPNQ